MSRARSSLLFLGLLLAVQLGAILITLWVNFGVALGLHPESVQLSDAYAPGIALLLVSWLASRQRRIWDGVAVGAGTVSLWLLVFAFLATRFLPEFWGDARPTLSHLVWWMFALVVATLGGWLGVRFPSRWVGVAGCLFMLLALWGRQLWWSENAFESLAPDKHRERDLKIGDETGEAKPIIVEPDGTSIFVVSFDLRKINFNLADDDWDDAHPFDNRNATWLGKAQDRVWQNLEMRYSKRLLCLTNGGFFDSRSPLIATHQAPLLHAGEVRYPDFSLQKDWPDQAVVMAWKREGGILKPTIIRESASTSLTQFDGGLGGVRVLIVNGKPATLRPGMGGTTLKCSRTSVAWNDRIFAILSVRDPDGEADSVRHNKREKHGEHGVQVGGWDVVQVQSYWKRQGFPNAVLFDGGESAQISVRLPWSVRATQSSYHFSRTLGFYQGRPLRAVWPLWPPTMANGGVLNWFGVVQAS